MRSQLYRWFEQHQWAGDALLAFAFFVVLAVNSRYFPSEPFAPPVLLLATLPLLFRRSRPELALGLAVAVLLLHLSVIAETSFAVALAPIVVHSTVAHARSAFWGRLALAAGLAGSVLGPVRWGYVHADDLTVAAMAGGLCAATVVVAFVLGERQRDQREHQAEQLATMADRAVLLATERDQRATIAAAAERARIARDLHDIVAHSLSVVVVQADGGAAAVAARPELAASVLSTIAETSRDALAELRRLVGVLRSGSEDGSRATYAPAPGIDDLPALVRQLQHSGVAAALTIEGPRFALSAGLDLTVYRLVQEGLTNVLKHAGPGAAAEVALHYGRDWLQVTVSDDGRGAAAPGAPDGHGLIGMRERVWLQGGTLTVGPRTGGGFAVTARFPLPAGAR